MRVGRAPRSVPDIDWIWIYSTFWSTYNTSGFFVNFPRAYFRLILLKQWNLCTFYLPFKANVAVLSRLGGGSKSRAVAAAAVKRFRREIAATAALLLLLPDCQILFTALFWSLHIDGANQNFMGEIISVVLRPGVYRSDSWNDSLECFNYLGVFHTWFQFWWNNTREHWFSMHAFLAFFGPPPCTLSAHTRAK